MALQKLHRKHDTRIQSIDSRPTIMQIALRYTQRSTLLFIPDVHKLMELGARKQWVQNDVEQIAC